MASRALVKNLRPPILMPPSTLYLPACLACRLQFRKPLTFSKKQNLGLRKSTQESRFSMRCVLRSLAFLNMFS